MAISEKKRADILAAIERLYRSTGKAPKVQEIIAEMGGGSASYVTPVRREWVESMEKAKTVARKMPDAVRQIMESATAAMWEVTTGEADAELAEYKLKAEEQAATLTAERDAALGDVERLEADSELQAIELAGAKDLAEGLRAQLAQAMQQVGELQGANTLLQQKAESLTAQLEDKTAQLAEVKGELAEVKRSHANLQKELLALAKGKM
jgi:chromosome segregation ATPase|tara:strand:+ start:30611 stop:31237 length:627 start_codon:yes stop_codon:yes gene_type:complete